MTNTPDNDHHWISRCFDLARRGIGAVSPNPPVGAVLVYDNRILGEGFHTRFGGPHAEVEAFRSVADADRHLIPKATLYVSLEPCCITGKTPPCTDLILREGVMDVRISTTDPNPLIANKGVELLRSKGINVITGILEKEGMELIRSFQTNILHHRPYVILKWAQSKNGYIGKPDEKIWLSHPYTNIWTHKKRSMVDAIMVGARTVLNDDPQLTTRDYEGRSPHRVIYDPNGILSTKFRVFNDDGCRVFYFSKEENFKVSGNHIIKFSLTDDSLHPEQILKALFLERIGILLIEGGAYLHNLFIEQHAWDEAWVIRTENELNAGIKAPVVKGRLKDQYDIGSDQILTILNDMNL
ncbi:MAG: bifunctional diaminohydroxyphosphoribosylaminopyrimidine deaminase/5-amino-6-(5-phosphoribosylamino)uracil reductase RibD [Saprospiraceae bacterium]|uniref:Riboflavin biosynthesis protein RibD n=1 Tax=Candidatus Opimibacter skivensis TaxID=2982028 RepID=A0A9D7SVP1_9BACT|nr:bifunctional diaminohydroxyphosphoribosylaminopyrimidine deaminase/5-amino-6-(5-phosphoribosylamino)uracil reductase RibD [Candidatus Opimibacter skivensis]